MKKFVRGKPKQRPKPSVLPNPAKPLKTKGFTLPLTLTSPSHREFEEEVKVRGSVSSCMGLVGLGRRGLGSRGKGLIFLCRKILGRHPKILRLKKSDR